MSPDELASARAIASSIADEAGALALSGFRTGTRIEKKGEIDLVTHFDRECESLIRARLATAFPTHRIVGEEGEPQGEGELVWFVDPIDGTTNFAHGLPYFCVSIGLFRGPLPLVGAIAAPALGISWAAHRGGGTTRNGVACRVSSTDALSEALVATGFAYDRWHSEDDNLEEHDRFVKVTRGVRRCGAAALDLAFVADGTFDGYWEQNLKPWDVAAGTVLVTEAGGTVTDYLGEATTPEAGQIVCGSPGLHGAILRLVHEARDARGLSRTGIRRDR